MKSSKRKNLIPLFSRPRIREARKNRVTILLNDSEMRAIERYCSKYKVKNRSRFVRETVMREILQKFEKDTPTLFD